MATAVVMNPPRKRRRRRNSWRGHRKAHCLAAKRGWRRRRAKLKGRRRRKGSKRSRAGRRAWRTRQARAGSPMVWIKQARGVKVRRRRRGRRRKAKNLYPHWVPEYASNPGRKRRRRRGRRRARNARFRYGRKRARNLYPHWIPSYSNPSWVPHYAMNPRGNVIGTLTSGFKPSVLMQAVPVVGGVIGNAWLTGFVSRWMPGMLQSGIGNKILGLATAGLLGAGVGIVSPRSAAPVFLGGVIEVVTRGVREYVLPKVGLSGCCPGSMGYIGDYLTPQNAASARPLGCMGAGCMGEYLTMQNVRDARPLGDYALEMETGDYMPDFSEATGLNDVHLPSYAQATGLNPYPYGMQGLADPIEAVSGFELATA